MPDYNSKMTANVKGFDNQIDFTTPATNKLKVRALRDAISQEGTEQDELRMFLDKMDPNARNGLYVALTALEAAITNV